MVLDAVLPTTAGVLCIDSQAELTLVLARASGPIPQAATCRLRAVLVAAVSSRARRTGGTLYTSTAPATPYVQFYRNAYTDFTAGLSLSGPLLQTYG